MSLRRLPLRVNGDPGGQRGDVIVLKLGETFEVIGTNSLTDQSFIASPMVAGNDLYLRSRTHLFRIVEE